jgi:hypothetical protein
MLVYKEYWSWIPNARLQQMDGWVGSRASLHATKVTDISG